MPLPVPNYLILNRFVRAGSIYINSTLHESALLNYVNAILITSCLFDIWVITTINDIAIRCCNAVVFLELQCRSLRFW